MCDEVWELNSRRFAHLPDFADAEEHGAGNPVTIRSGNVEYKLDWDIYKQVYVID